MFVQDSEHGSRVYSSCESDILLEYDSKKEIAIEEEIW
jgi:hypothetical protein